MIQYSEVVPGNRIWDNMLKLNKTNCMEEEILSGHSIVYFGPGKWDGLWRNRHQLMSRFARFNKVMYVEPLVYLNQLRHQYLYRGPSGWKELIRLAMQNRLEIGPNNLYIYRSNPFLPISGRFPFDKITLWAWKSRLKITMKKLGFSKPIIWLSQPGMGKFIGSFNERLVIYHVVDEYLAYGNMNAERKANTKKLEKQVLEKADLVIVVSDKLKDSKGVFNKNIHIVSNGVDYESYDKALLCDDQLPSDIGRLPKPVIGYSGLIAKRLDLELIEHIAVSHPEWSLVLIGAIDDRECASILNRLRQLHNVHFLGLKKIKEVPYYVKAFDVGIIPYVISEETENLNPLKLYDFLAIGIPIVTTNFSAAREFRNVVYVTDSKETFTHCVEKALLENDASLFAERRSVASLNSWEHRVKQLSFLIKSRLGYNQ